MNRKVKKRTQILNQRLQKLHLQLAGAKKQAVEANEVSDLEKEIAQAEADMVKLKSS